MAFRPSFRPGDRVEIAPRFDQWMRGDRYGDVVKHSQRFGVYVKMDKSGKTLRFAPDDLTLVNPRKRKMTTKARRFISRTVRRYARRGEYKPRQRVAVAYAKARRRGYKVPRKNPNGRSESQAWRIVRSAATRLLEQTKLPPFVHRHATQLWQLSETMLDQLAGGVHANPHLAIVGGNPPLGKVTEIRYKRDVGENQGLYRHRFKRGHEPRLVALSDGSLRVG